MPNLLSGLAAASKNPSLPGRLRLEFEIMARQINSQFRTIGETPDAETANPELYDRLIENTDRLRELIARAGTALELVLTL
jgi:hypothetical protein